MSRPHTPVAADLDWSVILEQAAAFVTTEYASLDRSSRPVTWPVTPYAGAGGSTLDISTGLGYPLKAERARRNNRVALSFTHPLGSGIEAPATFVVQGVASVRDADLRANSARYLALSKERFPHMYASIPPMMLRRMAFYWARIWVEVTPVRVLWWADGDLDRAPRLWTPDTTFLAAPSDPAPRGTGAGSWNTAPPVDWRVRSRGALQRLGMPVLTTVSSDGWPLPLPARHAEETPSGFRIRPPAGIEVADGPAALTFHGHREVFDSQENLTLVGTCHVSDDGTAHFDADRALNDFIMPRHPIRRMLYLLAAGRRLNQRLTGEAERRGQTVPRFEELGFTR